MKENSMDSYNAITNMVLYTMQRDTKAYLFRRKKSTNKNL